MDVNKWRNLVPFHVGHEEIIISGNTHFFKPMFFDPYYHVSTFSRKIKSFVGKNAALLFCYFCNDYANEFDVMSNCKI
jgi:hypothetical protein